MFNRQAKIILFLALPTFLSTISFNVGALEDPTQPPSFVSSSDAAGSAQLPIWIVSSILISKDRRLAVVNGVTLKRGDKVGGAIVISISPTAVKLRNSVETFTVKLLPAQVKSVRKK